MFLMVALFTLPDVHTRFPLTEVKITMEKIKRWKHFWNLEDLIFSRAIDVMGFRNGRLLSHQPPP